MNTALVGFASLLLSLVIPSPSHICTWESDCYLQGPLVDNGTNEPVIVDDGSSGNTGMAGCDHCKVVAMKFKVTWPVTEAAYITHPGGSQTQDVSAGTTIGYNIAPAGDNATIACGGSWQAGAFQAGAGNSTIRFNCTACQ